MDYYGLTRMHRDSPNYALHLFFNAGKCFSSWNVLMTITRMPRPRFEFPEIKSCAEKTKFRNSTRISYRNLRWKDKILHPPVLHVFIALSFSSTYLVGHARGASSNHCVFYNYPRTGSIACSLRSLQLDHWCNMNSHQCKYSMAYSVDWLAMMYLQQILFHFLQPTFLQLCCVGYLQLIISHFILAHALAFQVILFNCKQSDATVSTLPFTTFVYCCKGEVNPLFCELRHEIKLTQHDRCDKRCMCAESFISNLYMGWKEAAYTCFPVLCVDTTTLFRWQWKESDVIVVVIHLVQKIEVMVERLGV